uniref:Uncharacterized protein n=1 Tax=Cyprinus carpio TaxID=7962 RepID=A0A8C1R148_CYPCA
MLMSHLEEPKLTDDEEPPTEQDKKRKLVTVHSISLQQFVYEKLKAQQMLVFLISQYNDFNLKMVIFFYYCLALILFRS